MPYVILSLGAIAGYLDYLGAPNLLAALALLRGEIFTYSPPFYKWLGAIIIIGMFGYIPEMRPVATAMLILLILSIVLTKNRPSVTTTVLNSL